MGSSNNQNSTGRRGRRQVQSTNQITGKGRSLALTAVMLSMFFSSLDQTVVSTAMPTIISDLGAFNLYAWVFTAYILASAVTVPIYGRLSDTYGRKPFYVFGLSVFLIGSVICGLAESMNMLIFARAVQGIGGGAMMSMPRATIGDIFNPRERARWMGAIMGVFGLASLVGPAIGGWFTDHLSWRWVFFINIPVALLALGMLIYALPTVRTEKHPHIDWSGSILLGTGLVAMLLGFTWGGTAYAWTSWREIMLFAIAAVMLAAFIFNERRVTEPIVVMSAFANRTFSLTMVISLFMMMSMFSVMMFLPLFIQGVLGITAEQSGYLLTPMTLSFMIGSIISGQLMTRTGRYKVQSVFGGALLVTGAWLMYHLTADTTWPIVVRNMVVLGIGIGSIMPVIGTVIQNLFPYRILGTINATQQTIQTTAGAIAAPIFGTIMANKFTEQLPQLLPAQLKQVFAALPPEQQAMLNDPQGLASAGAQAALQEKFASFGPMGQQLYEQFVNALHQALTAGFVKVYAVSFVFAVLTFLATLAIREIPLKNEEFFEEATAKK